MAREFTLPDLGEGIAEAQVVRLLIKAGDTIAEDQSLLEVETDKAAVEIPSPYAGTATKVHVEEGQTINVGDVLVTFDGNGSAATAPSATKDADGKKAGAPTPVAPAPQPSAAPTSPTTPAARRTTSPAAPAVRKLARDMGIDLDSVTGSGPGGRVTRDDLQRHGASQAAAISSPTAATPATPPHAMTRPTIEPIQPPPGELGTDKWGTIRRSSLSQIRKTIAGRMTQSAFTVPHVTQGDEADITDLDRLRRELTEATGGKPKLTVMSFLIRSVCIALRRFPMFNASFDHEAQQIIYKDYINIGVAVDTERGLIVPVIRNADTLSLTGIATTLRSIAERIRNTQFGIDDLRGGTFTISNVGALGGTFSTPIINYPEVAILGLGRSREVPVVRGDAIVRAITLPLNLSFDHRATDGANAARFTREIISYLEQPTRLLLH